MRDFRLWWMIGLYEEGKSPGEDRLERNTGKALTTMNVPDGTKKPLRPLSQKMGPLETIDQDVEIS